MPRQTEQLEREAEQARGELAFSLEELRSRMTPAEIIDEVVHYASDTPVGEFARNLARDVRASPLPLLVIFAAGAVLLLGCPPGAPSWPAVNKPKMSQALAVNATVNYWDRIALTATRYPASQSPLPERSGVSS